LDEEGQGAETHKASPVMRDAAPVIQFKEK
jgi:hypothetical protein